jgi:hypothetical protein
VENGKQATHPNLIRQRITRNKRNGTPAVGKPQKTYQKCKFMMFEENPKKMPAADFPLYKMKVLLYTALLCFLACRTPPRISYGVIKG